MVTLHIEFKHVNHLAISTNFFNDKSLIEGLEKSNFSPKSSEFGPYSCVCVKNKTRR